MFHSPQYMCLKLLTRVRYDWTIINYLSVKVLNKLTNTFPLTITIGRTSDRAFQRKGPTFRKMQFIAIATNFLKNKRNRWKLAWIGVVAAATFGMFAQIWYQVAEFITEPKSTTLSPWYPDKLPNMLYCPAAIFRNEYMEQNLTGSDKAFFDYVHRTAKVPAPADNVPCVYMDGFKTAGQLFWLGQNSNYSTMAEKDSAVQTGYVDNALQKQMLILNGAMKDNLNGHMQRSNITFQRLYEDASINADEVFEYAKYGGSEDLVVTKRFTMSGVCFHVEQPTRSHDLQLRLHSYTTVLK